MAQMTPDDRRHAIELGIGMLSEFLYEGEFKIFNDLPPEDQSAAVTGLLSIAGGMVYIFKDVRKDEKVTDTMAALSTMAYMSLEEKLQNEAE